MNEKISVLKAEIAAEEAAIAQIYTRLAVFKEPPEDPEQAIIAGYYLHNLYTAFEQLATLVARTFENQIEDRSQWHSQLLRRMTLDIEGIRPRLFSEPTYACLNELRAFRHVFRSAYSTDLAPERLAIVFQRALELRKLYPADMARFREFLGGL
jgi:hypothetical protein